MKLVWHRCPGGPPAAGAEPRPCIVLLSWVGAQARHISTYVQLFHSCGWDVLAAAPPALAIWAPRWAAANARRVLAALEAELSAAGDRPLVFFCFSGAIKSVYYRLLQLLAGGGPEAAAFASVRRCAAGQAFDSPVDFTSEAGQHLLAPTGPGALPSLARGALAAAAGALDFALLERFEADRAALWAALRHPPFKGPVLLLFSYSDGLVDARRAAALAKDLRLSGHAVVEQTWDDSPHVAHVVAHPEQYASSVRWLLAEAAAEWAARGARRDGAIAPAAASAPERDEPAAAAAAWAAAVERGAPGVALQAACACERGGGPPDWALERHAAPQHQHPRACAHAWHPPPQQQQQYERQPCGAQTAAPWPPPLQQQHSYHYYEWRDADDYADDYAPLTTRGDASTEERARSVMRDLDLSPGTIDAVAAQIAQQSASSSWAAAPQAGTGAAAGASGRAARARAAAHAPAAAPQLARSPLSHAAVGPVSVMEWPEEPFERLAAAGGAPAAAQHMWAPPAPAARRCARGDPLPALLQVLGGAPALEAAPADDFAAGGWAGGAGEALGRHSELYLPRLGVVVRRGSWQEPGMAAPVAANGGFAAPADGRAGPVFVRVRSRL